MITLTIGISIRRLNHLEYPAFVKMSQNGMTHKAANINIIIAPEAPMYIGMSPIVSGIVFSFRMVCSLPSEIRHSQVSLTYALRQRHSGWEPRGLKNTWFVGRYQKRSLLIPFKLAVSTPVANITTEHNCAQPSHTNLTQPRLSQGQLSGQLRSLAEMNI